MALHRLAAASGFFVSAAVWPLIVRSFTQFTMTPYERAMQTSWCGSAPHETASFLGHCAVCFVGAAALAASGLIVLLANEGVHAHMRSPASAWRGRAFSRTRLRMRR